MSFPFYRQLDAMDCGPSCLRMIAKYYGKTYTLQTLRDRSYITREGVSMLGIGDAADSIGMRTVGVRIGYEKLAKEVPLPCIVHWKQNHFIVVYKIKKNKVYVSDPSMGLNVMNIETFKKGWISTVIQGEERGVAMLLEPSPDFYNETGEKLDKSNFSFLFTYLRPYRKYFLQIGIGILIGSVLSLMFPILTQMTVDYGIGNRNLDFIFVILIAQLMLTLSQTAVGMIRSWLSLHINTRVSIALISDFLIKLMKLPIGFFDIKKTGDILQRIGDNSRIQGFLTGTAFSMVFALFNFVVYSIVMATYNWWLLLILYVGWSVDVLWVTLFLKKRRQLDYRRFAQSSTNQSNIIQLITGMQEIKLHNCEQQKRWEWERIQAQQFKLSVEGLALGQYQEAGALLLSQSKGILISYLSAKAVVDGSMTLGMMMGVQFIIGQVSGPLQQMLGFIQSIQDAKISLERLNEINLKDNEDEESEVEKEGKKEKTKIVVKSEDKLKYFPENQTITLKNILFQYEGPRSEKVLKDVSFEIPEKKITAIVGTSGSGKTTILKLLLGFYQPVEGEILIGTTPLHLFNSRSWRHRCGTVMQDGFIFSDTIANNVGIGDEVPDREKVSNAVKTANIKEFIESMPLGYNTKIGMEGHGLSQGQKQRILIARAVYKNPNYLFFDEATNALDANNEKTIMENMDQFFKGKTVVIVAHRLSTVKNADQIIVLEKGEIIEKGTHKDLVEKQGAYYNLVKNQLELGN